MTPENVRRKISSLRRLILDPAAAGTPEAETAKRLMAELVKKYNVTEKELSSIAFREKPSDFSALAAAFKKAGISPSSRQPKGSL